MKKLLLFGLLISALASAEITPSKGEYDPRVRILDYNPMNVVKISTFYGVSTHIQFGEGENILDVSSGDEHAWSITWNGYHLFLKPTAEKADTNITVLTSKRVYHFATVVLSRDTGDAKAWSDKNLIYSLKFRYPDDERTSAMQIAQMQAEREAERVRMAEERARIEEMKLRLFEATQAKKNVQNYDYWVAGSSEVSPTAARDDGRFIYLTFTNNRDMPAVYQVDEYDNEALINTNVIDGNTIVVQRLVRRLMLRRGNAVASVVNKSFDQDGGTDNTTGTISPGVIRTIKGVQ